MSALSVERTQLKDLPSVFGDAEPAEETKWERATGTPAWEQAPKATGEVNSNRLKSMLAGLKKAE